MKFLIFSDLDGTFLDHRSYSFGNLKIFINKIKQGNTIVFNTSKTFSEILKINKQLELKSPFIVENGACIFFPQSYKDNLDINKDYFKYHGYLGYSLANHNLQKIVTRVSPLQKKYKFRFYSELSDQKISEITNLRMDDIKRSKKRLFSNPIFWDDSFNKIAKFKSEIVSLNNHFKVFQGGRFIHILENYDKGIALKKYLEIIKPSMDVECTTVSLGDSENDICMLESTDYSCIVKGEGKKISLTKTNKIYFSKTKAPLGWQESLENVFRMENKNF
tara:strand:- start:512 stop:1339 length:828 start_codon:yes stop_codon:yes gene_type:complete